ncbi:hypothetical protein H4R33_003334 [Dimargaris cristalligena]|uniref:Ankyrin repeat-containing domain protein n=1 Tax=Dimargaris cristalligena TaxID=215637 RepID=A0A4Q0A0H1_9FUNG|nr:hypothetical protein H4R33_003334 [Dimargaris cristalligena]RKP38762.1 hypothetical protein BJ085DRAFT_40605 [Dimargaris cristalligena]|eukprot:RKP38762.1 hypothetical protein BJ085DRAFT_40605 [Dimargaris cristalligena]
MDTEQILFSFYFIIMANDSRGLRKLLANPAHRPLVNNPIIRDDHGCFNSLMLALSLGHVECAQLLVGAGADPTYTIDGVAPIFWAIRNPRGLLQLLSFDDGVDINVLDGVGKSVFQRARENKYSQSLHILQAEKMKREGSTAGHPMLRVMAPHLY